MKLAGKVVIVTGGGRGIGRAFVQRIAREEPRAIVVADRDPSAAEEVAKSIPNAIAAACDVGREEDVTRVIRDASERFGGVDLMCSNAGVGSAKGIEEGSDEDWQRLWDINLMSHVWAARALLPSAARPGGTYLVITASAAGLLAMIGDAPYTVTKHAAIGLAEWLAITHGDRGMKVSCVCPLFVNTDLLRSALALAGGATIEKSGTVIEPEQVAEAVVAGVEKETFMILPHPEVAGYFQKKAGDHDRWIASMRKLRDLK